MDRPLNCSWPVIISGCQVILYSYIFKILLYFLYYTPTHRVGAILQSPCPSVRSHFRNRYLSFYWKKWFYIWYMALAWWLVPCLPFPGLPHIYFLFTVRLRIFHVCCNENFRNSYLSFYWKKWFYILYMALAWWLVPCLPFLGLPHIYFLFTMWLTNERVGAFLARRSVQHLVCLEFTILHPKILYFSKTMRKKSWIFNYEWKFYINNK